MVEAFNINYANIPAAFSFRANPTFNTNIIYPDPWASGSSSGILENIGGNGFFTYSGTGYFNGNNYFKLSNNYSLNNSIILLSYERLRSGNEILLSSVTGNSINNYAGFNVGINDANKLYLKYWNNVEGPFTFTYTGVLSDKNIVVVNRINSVITLGHFNNNTFEFSSQEFEIFQNNFINSSNLYVGGNPNSTSWDTNRPSNFSGYVDRLYIFDNTPFVYSDVLARGFFSEPTGFAGDLEEYCYVTGFLSGSGYSYSTVTGVLVSGFQSGITGITGYEEIISGYIYTGITGYSGQYLGTYIDNCGNNIDIVEQIALSGEIYNEIRTTVGLTGITYVTGFTEVELVGIDSGIENVFVTGLVCDSYFNNIGDVLYAYDEDYLKSLSFKEINLLSTINPNTVAPTGNDIIEIYAEPYQPKTLEYNVGLTFDNLNENYFYIDKEFKQNEVLMFGNGQALIDNGYELIPSGYDIIRNPKFDYFITGTTVETNRFFGIKDYLFYDYSSGDFQVLELNNYESGTILPIVGYENAFIFRNGQKLIPGIDYGIFTSNLIQSLSGSTGYNDNFGQSFSTNIDGSIIFVSAPLYKNNLNLNIGNVYIYKKILGQYNLIQEISGTTINESFGNNLSASSDGRIIAISNNSVGNGQVWIYQSNDLSNWTLYQTLSGNVGATRFGEKLALSPDGTVLTVGSRTDVVSPDSTGSMWVYTGGFNNTWTQTQKITGLMNPIGFQDIGWPSNQVLNSGGNIVCIGFDSKQVGTDAFAGVVSVYTGLNGVYNFSQELIGDPVGQSSGDLFGRSLGISSNGNVLTVGSLHDQNFEKRTLDGALFIFETGANKKFTLKQKILGDFEEKNRINDRFGYFTDMSDDGSIIVTSSQHDSDDWENPNVPGGEQNDGAVWLLGKSTNNWYLIKKIKSTIPNSYFGRFSKISRDGLVFITSRNQYQNNPNGPRAIDIFEQSIGLSFNFNITGDSDIFLIKSSNILFNKYLTEFSEINIQEGFNHGCSQVYYNGIRQKINSNYIENSKYDLISGVFKESNEFKKLIYNNTNDFFV